jgi:DHA1 family bicyclomycin/chloramphenicol resistance-like MFS transporter
MWRMPDASQPGPALAATPRWLTATLTAVVALGPLTMSTYAPSMPAIADALGTTPGLVQATLGVYLAGFALGQLLYGPLSDRFGRRRMLLLGLVVFVAGSAVCGFAGSIGTLLLGRVVQAVGVCAGSALGRAMVRDVYAREEAARVLAFVGMALAVAPAVGPLLGGQLQAAFDWHAIFAVLGAAGIAAALAVALLPETNRDPDPDALRPARLASTYAAIARNRTFLGYCAVGAATLGGLFTYHSVAPFLLIGVAGLSPEEYGWVNLLTVGAYFAGSFVANRFGARIGLDRAVAASAALVLAGAALLLVCSLAAPASVATVMGPVMLWTAGMGLALPNSMAGALGPFPRAAGSASALMGFAQMGVGALGSVALARVGGGTAVPLALVLLALGGAGYGLWFALVWRRGPS